MGTKKKIVQQVTQKVVEDGELKSSSETTVYQVEREPDFVKMYLQDLLRISDIPKASNSILLSILKRMTYGTNEIVLILPVKKSIAKELGISLITITKAIEAFTEKSILIRKDRGFFLVNPYFFGKGKWEEIREIRLAVEYSRKGKMILRTTFDKQIPMFGEEFENEKVQSDS